MNVTSALLKKVISEADSETWARIRKHYLPAEYQPIYSVVTKHFEELGKLPSFDALKLSVRNNSILDKVYAIEAAELVDIDNKQLLEFLKNEYTQEEIMDQVSKYLDESIMMDSAKDNVQKLQEIIVHVEDRVELKDPDQDMSRIELFASEEELAKSFPLGLNSEYDSQMRFMPGDYILIGGKRGSGKSISCSNIAVHTFENLKKSSIYFTIEMSTRAILQRNCSIATGIPASSLRLRRLTHGEWEKVAQWWSSRFEGGHEAFLKYNQDHHSFDELHKDLAKCSLLPDRQYDIVYDPSLTLSTMRSELDKKVEKLDPAVIIVDYVNQVKRVQHSKTGQYTWDEQIEISKALKEIAQIYGRPLISPYQTDATGEARMAKGILDSADIAFSLEAHDDCITYKCVKARDTNDDIDFTSKTNWDCLQVGPESAVPPDKKKKKSKETNEDVYDM